MTLPKTPLSHRIKFYIRQLMPPMLWDFLKQCQENRRKYYGQHKLDQTLETYLNYDNGFFVELGANDGKSQSNTLYFERYRNWTGVLVEPTPHNYLQCRKNRSPHTHIFSYACTSFDYPDKFVEIVYSDLMSTPVGLESDVADAHTHVRADKTLPAQTGEHISFGALAAPLHHLLVTANAPQVIDLLSLDVEGAEMDVLKGIDHTHFRFKYMCIECRDIDKLSAYLQHIGYEFIKKLSSRDYLFKNKN